MIRQTRSQPLSLGPEKEKMVYLCLYRTTTQKLKVAMILHKELMSTNEMCQHMDITVKEFEKSDLTDFIRSFCLDSEKESSRYTVGFDTTIYYTNLRMVLCVWGFIRMGLYSKGRLIEEIRYSKVVVLGRASVKCRFAGCV